MAMTQVVSGSRVVVRSAVRVLDRVDSALHGIRLRLRVMELRRDRTLCREIDRLAEEADHVGFDPNACADLDALLAEAERGQ